MAVSSMLHMARATGPAMFPIATLSVSNYNVYMVTDIVRVVVWAPLYGLGMAVTAVGAVATVPVYAALVVRDRLHGRAGAVQGR